VDVVVNNMNATPDVFRLDLRPGAHWITVNLVGTRSNRNAIGARVTVAAGGGVQVQEVRGGGSYLSQNDLRVHFGLGPATRIDRLVVRWPNGEDEQWNDVPVDRIVTLTEGAGTRGASR